MRLRILIGFLALALGLGSLALWKRAQDTVALEREARFSKPFSDSLLAFQQKRYVDAEAILTGLLQETERDSPGSIHQASVLHGLGAVTYLQHRESEALYRKALTIQEAQLSPDDADLGRTLGGLADVRYKQGNSSEAALLRKRSRAIYEKAGPSQTISEAVVLIERGESRAAEGNYKEAESLYKQAVEADEAKYGPDHPKVADDLNFLAKLYRDEEGIPIEAAEPVFQKMLAIRQKNFGQDSPEAAETVSDLSLLYFYKKKFEQGESFAASALPIQEKAFGPNGLEVSTTLNRLGLCQRDLDKLDQAEVSLARALAIREKRLQPDHPWIAISIENLASVYRAQGQVEKATLLLESSRAERRKNDAKR